MLRALYLNPWCVWHNVDKDVWCHVVSLGPNGFTNSVIITTVLHGSSFHESRIPTRFCLHFQRMLDSLPSQHLPDMCAAIVKASYVEKLQVLDAVDLTERFKRTLPLLMRQIEVGSQPLSHWGQDKMADTLQAAIFKFIFFNENCCILIQILPKFVPNVSINNMPVLVR